MKMEIMEKVHILQTLGRKEIHSMREREEQMKRKEMVVLMDKKDE